MHVWSSCVVAAVLRVRDIRHEESATRAIPGAEGES